MTTGQAWLVGGEQFAADAMNAADAFYDMSEPMGKTAKTVFSRAKSTVPRRTGALAASMIPKSTQMMAEVSSRLIYANPIHWGWRGHGIEPSMWLVDAAHETEPMWVRHFIDDTDKILDTMRKDYRALS